MSRSIRGEGGGIMVVAALMIPVFLMFTALVIDAGSWFTHKRQLQNRADAAAFAAGVEYANSRKACVQTPADADDAQAKLDTANAIADAARQYAGDPEDTDYSTGNAPDLHNIEIARQDENQTKNYADVMINSDSSNDYNDDTGFTDGGVGNVANPCFRHTVGDDVSAPGYWTDVKVKERDLPFATSLFVKAGVLSRNIARARVDIRPAVSGHRFLPLAVPNNIITKVQVRYYKECGSGAPSLIATRDLAPLPAADQSGFASAGGGMLWGLPSAGDATVGDKNRSFDLVLPAYDPACGDYVPVGVEVRIASRDDVDIDTPTCQYLLDTARYADCFHRLSQIRVWNDGDADSQIRIPRITLSGGCGAPQDAYFSRLPVAELNCKYDVEVQVNWGTRNTGTTNVPANFTVSAGGTNVPLVSWVPGGVSTYATSGGAITANPGANPLTITANWLDQTNGHTWAGKVCKPGNTPCKDSVNDGHRAFVGTGSTAGAVALVGTSQSPIVAGLPGTPFDNHRSGGGPADCSDSDTCAVFPTVGTVSVLKTGVYTTLRLDDSQAENQSVQCDPDHSQAFPAFQYGCKPWFGANLWTSPWWVGPTGAKQCPPDGDWFSYSDEGAGFGVNSADNPWRCVLTAPGVKTGQVGDYMAVATDNCDDIQNNSCQVNSFDCNYDGNYDGKGGTPGWTTNGGIDGVIPPNPEKLGSAYPRVVNLFIVPYRGSKGLTGSKDEIPVLGFASFYVMNWTGSNNKQNDPCPDKTWGNVNLPDPPAGAISGVFVETVDYEPGPVDPSATCVEDQLTPCRVTLVR